MIIIKLKSGIELKYKGRIDLSVREYFPEVLFVVAQNSKSISGFTWHADTYDHIYLEDIEEIKGK